MDKTSIQSLNEIKFCQEEQEGTEVDANWKVMILNLQVLTSLI